MAENPDDVLHVEGGKPLNGTIKVRGAKNFVSKAMVAALLAPGKSVLKNVHPDPVFRPARAPFG